MRAWIIWYVVKLAYPVIPYSGTRAMLQNRLQRWLEGR
jgi:hypothetical protein